MKSTYQELPKSMFCNCKNGKPCADTCFEIQKAIATARAEGAKAMRDYIILAGVEIDGKDYVPLDGILRRSKTLLQALTTKEIDHE